MHLTHRNRVGYSRLKRLEYPPLRSPLSSGEGLCCASVFIDVQKGQLKRALSAGEGGPQRKAIANTWSDWRTRLRWVRCIIRTLFHILRKEKQKPVQGLLNSFYSILC